MPTNGDTPLEGSLRWGKADQSNTILHTTHASQPKPEDSSTQRLQRASRTIAPCRNDGHDHFHTYTRREKCLENKEYTCVWSNNHDTHTRRPLKKPSVILLCYEPGSPVTRVCMQAGWLRVHLLPSYPLLQVRTSLCLCVVCVDKNAT